MFMDGVGNPGTSTGGKEKTRRQMLGGWEGNFEKSASRPQRAGCARNPCLRRHGEVAGRSSGRSAERLIHILCEK
jgi:hypothetical protein